MIYNYHTHTKRCFHAGGEDEEYVEKAIENGVKTLGFSDHAPYLFPDTNYYSSFRMKTEQIFEYAESVLADVEGKMKELKAVVYSESIKTDDYFAQTLDVLAENIQELRMGK